MATAATSGSPVVGETLVCSEPVITGGIGPYQRDYGWTDDSNAMIFESRYHGQTFVLTDQEIGKNMKCIVQCTDKGWSGGQSIPVTSNSVGPVAAPGPAVKFDQNTQPLGFTFERSLRFSINVRAIGNYVLTYRWEFLNPSDKWVIANSGNVEAQYPSAVFTLVDGAMSPQLSMTWVDGKGPEVFRCAVTDTEMEPTPGGAMPVASTTAYSENCIAMYPV